MIKMNSPIFRDKNWLHVVQDFAPVNVGEWVELVVTASRITNNMKIYLDGVLIDFVVFPDGEWLATNQTSFLFDGPVNKL